MARYTKTNISTISGVNSELQKISDAFDDQLDRLGATPNSMSADLDLNSNSIINVALAYSGPILPPLLGTLVTTALLVMILLYSLFPRALERAVRFHDVSRVKDLVLLSLSNTEYSRRFLKLNEMIAESVEDENSEMVD